MFNKTFSYPDKSAGHFLVQFFCMSWQGSAELTSIQLLLREHLPPKKLSPRMKDTAAFKCFTL